MTISQQTKLDEIYHQYQVTLNRKSHTEEEVRMTIEAILSIGCKESLIWFFENKPSQFNIRFLLCFPEIWGNLKYHEWTYISDMIKRPSSPKYLMEDYGQFDDFIFLYNYVNVNWHEYILYKSSLQIEDKKKLLNYINIFISNINKLYPRILSLNHGDTSSLKDLNADIVANGISPVSETHKYQKIIAHGLDKQSGEAMKS